MTDFITPPDHGKFLAKKLFGPSGCIIDGAVAYIEPGGGGPLTPHTHEHSHLFIVTSGRAKIIFEDEEVTINANESYLVNGCRRHTVVNDSDQTTVMIGISVTNK